MTQWKNFWMYLQMLFLLTQHNRRASNRYKINRAFWLSKPTICRKNSSNDDNQRSLLDFHDFFTCKCSFCWRCTIDVVRIVAKFFGSMVPSLSVRLLTAPLSRLRWFGWKYNKKIHILPVKNQIKPQFNKRSWLWRHLICRQNIMLEKYRLVWPQWWSCADVSQQGVDFTKKNQ